MAGRKDGSEESREAQKITIVEVAARAGVSIKTVSRVVNREPNVRDSTREKVEAAIAALGYRPNPSARGLAGNRSYSIGLLYQAPREFGYVRNVLDGVMAACEAEDYSLLMCPCSDEVDLAALERFIAQTRIDGAVLTAPICDSLAVTSLLEEQGVPFGQLAPSAHHGDWLSAQADDERASFELTEYLFALGHERIGFIKGHPAHGSSRKRLAGFTRAMEERGRALDPTLVRQGYFEFESGKTCAAELLSLPERPTAIFASNDDMAAGVVFVAREFGIDVPEQLSVVGFDDSMVAERTWPPLTTVRQPVTTMADALTRNLIRRLRGQSVEADETDAHYECELVVRDSAGPSPQADPWDAGL